MRAESAAGKQAAKRAGGSRARAARSGATRRKAASSAADLHAVLATLEGMGSAKVRDGLLRYGIVAPKAHGIAMGAIQRYAKSLGRDHGRALRLWKSGWYEARMVAICTAEPERLTAAQMDAWCKDFDNWGVCDTACWVLFDKTPLAWGRVAPWSRLKGEHQRRAAFALLASLALHDKQAEDARFAAALPLLERAADDGRNFVKKSVNWALRAIALRSAALHSACTTLAARLAESEAPSARWIGKDALRYYASAPARKRLAANEARRRRG